MKKENSAYPSKIKRTLGIEPKLWMILICLATLLTSCKEQDIEVSSIKLDKSTLTINTGAEYTLTATVSPQNATNKTVQWSSSDTTKVTVTQEGKITAITAGQSTITASVGALSVRCEVEVLPNQYICGNVKNNDGTWVATMWVNGEKTLLGDSTRLSMAFDIAVDHKNDIYVCGWEEINPGGGPSRGVVWKNGVEMTEWSQESKTSGYNGICIYQNSIYIVGDIANDDNRQLAAVWKDGQCTVLNTDQMYIESGASGISIINGDIHVAGYAAIEEANRRPRKAATWKNDSAMQLMPSDERSGQVMNITTVANAGQVDVYACGYLHDVQGTVAMVWKNGEVSEFSETTDGSANAYTISLVDNDFYLGGYATGSSGYIEPTYWKNKQPTTLAHPVTDNGGSINRMIVYNGTVYAVGQLDDRAVLWIGSEMIELRGSVAEAKSLFLK